MDKKALTGLIAIAMLAGSNDIIAQESIEATVDAERVATVPFAPPAAITSQAALQQSGRMATETALRGITVEAIAISLAFAAVAVGIVHGRDSDDITPPVHHAPVHN